MTNSNPLNNQPAPLVLRAAAVMFLLLLQGCASLDKNECMVADWRLIGYQDGVAGKSPTAMGEYRKDCAKHAVVPDLDAYRAGRAEGLQQYCKADTGYQLGNSGRGLSTVCPPHLSTEFRAAYEQGREIFLARTAVKRTHAQIHKRQEVLELLEEDKSYQLSELVSDGLRSEQRVLILYEISKLEQKSNNIEDEIAELEDELYEQQQYLNLLTQQASR